MTVFTCPICQRVYSTDSNRKSIVQMMRANAALCEQHCRAQVQARFGAGHSLFDLACLYRRLEAESAK